jgi:D-glycero-D-manno-heptose 1,7-bisphosphate phosphatase
MADSSKRAAVILDRDGTVIRDVGYLCREDQIEILPGVPNAIRSLRDHGFKIVVVTNQSAVARGRLSETDLGLIHGSLTARLAREGAVLDAIYYCPHHPTEGRGVYRVVCNCRKPKTGLVDQAIKDLGLDMDASYVVGDQKTDMELAERVGAVGILIDSNKKSGEVSPSEGGMARDLWQAAQWIVQQLAVNQESEGQR